MSVLKNPKHEQFARGLAGGKSQYDAHAYAGYKPHRGNASLLAQDKNIVARVAEILSERENIHAQSTAKAIERVSLTKEWIIAKLIDNAERALQAQQATNDEGEPIGDFKYEGSVANRALELLGKELGMFIDRKMVQNVDEFDDITDPSELRLKLIERAERIGARDVAARLAGGKRGTGEFTH